VIILHFLMSWNFQTNTSNLHDVKLQKYNVINLMLPIANREVID
jgi:hypothetical protein